MRETKQKLLEDHEDQLGIDGAERTTLIEGIEPNQQSWWVQGRVSPQGSVYLAQIEAPETFAADKDSAEVCIVSFDPSAMPDGIELRHYRLLFAVLIEGNCSTSALDFDERRLHADLTRAIEPEPYEVFAERSFDNGVSVTILSEVYARGRGVELEGMIAAHLGFERPRQSQIGIDRGFYVKPDGEAVAYQTAYDDDHAVCLFSNPPWPEAIEGHGTGTRPVRAETPEYRRYCLEQVSAAEEAYAAAQRKDWKDLPPPTVGPALNMNP